MSKVKLNFNSQEYQFAEYWSIKVASKMVSIPETTLRQYISNGNLKAYKPSKRLLLKRQELITFIETAA